MRHGFQPFDVIIYMLLTSGNLSYWDIDTDPNLDPDTDLYIFEKPGSKYDGETTNTK